MTAIPISFQATVFGEHVSLRQTVSCNENLAADAEILQSDALVAHPHFRGVVQSFSFYLLWRLVGDLKFALVMWFGTRIFALWVNMIQNYWTHAREFGYRRYDDDMTMP